MTTALIVLVLLLLLFGGGGYLFHVLWYLLVAALIVWLIGFFLRSAEGGGRWYRWESRQRLIDCLIQDGPHAGRRGEAKASLFSGGRR